MHLITYLHVHCHTGSFAQNSFQIDSINSSFNTKANKGEIGLYFGNNEKKILGYHKSEIWKRNVKTMISPLLFRLHCLTLTIPKFNFIFIYGLYYGGSCSTTLQYNVLQAWGYLGFTLLYSLIACSSVHYSALSFNRFTP